MKKAPTRKRADAEAASVRRSPCPVACCLDIVGDRWTLLVIRDLMLGRSRFKDFTASPESIPTNILTERLQRLLKHELVVQVAAEGSKHLGYELTKKGRSLLPILKAMKEWGLAWEPGTKAALTQN
jgi:DNA-binding HxlR family transcriptional regulator